MFSGFFGCSNILNQNYQIKISIFFCLQRLIITQ
nr:MAG TPA: hypothetical protein [Bacteriophage sp.]